MLVVALIRFLLDTLTAYDKISYSSTTYMPLEKLQYLFVFALAVECVVLLLAAHCDGGYWFLVVTSLMTVLIEVFFW